MQNNESIMSHEEFLLEMERDKRTRYAKGTVALIGVVVMIAFLLLAITQLAGSAGVFAN